jgi:hypothetical protein
MALLQHSRPLTPYNRNMAFIGSLKMAFSATLHCMMLNTSLNNQRTSRKMVTDRLKHLKAHDHSLLLTPIQDDYYQMLGLSSTANKVDIKVAAQQQLETLKQAYQILMDDEKRQAYDQKLKLHN